MSDKPTTTWVPIDQIVPHPANPNQMSPEARAKLRENIEATGYYPPVIVRSLEDSEDFEDLHEQGKFQIIDGEHRWLDQQDAGADEIEVRVWSGISDARAHILLATLNRLHGKDEPAKRRSLLRSIADLEPDTDLLSKILPETKAQIDKYLEEGGREVVGSAQDRARELSQQEAVTIFATPDDARTIRKSIRRWLEANDPDGEIEECREGQALAAICLEANDAPAAASNLS